MPPSPAKSPPIKLIFTTTSLRNVTIATELDEHYYEIVTPAWEAGCTRIKRLHADTGQMVVIAELTKDTENAPEYSGLRFIEPDKADGEFISPELFLGPTDTKRKIFGSFADLKSNQYRWQQSKGSIQLVKTDEPDCKALARFHRHHRHLGVLRMSERPYLEVEAELGPSMDTFIVSFLLAEGKRRR